MQETKKKILIVEDDPNFSSILKQRLELEGCVVLLAQDGREALGIYYSEKPDLILTDVLLPLLDGVGMAEKIKKRNPDFPIIFLTNIKDPAMEMPKGVEKGDYLVKSDIGLDDIAKAVKKKLRAQ